MGELRPHWTETLEDSEALDAVMSIAIRMHELNGMLGDIFQLHVIVDTNIIYADLLAKVRAKGQGAAGRPAVAELLAKRTLVGYFPQENIREIEEKCRELAARYGVPPEEVLAFWCEYQNHLHIVPAGDLELQRAGTQRLANRDPSDLAFLQAFHLTGANAILSNDKDFQESGAAVMPWSRLLVDLRHHARKEGVKAAVFLGTGMAIVFPVAALVGCIGLIYKALRRIPREALLLAAAGIGILLLIPQSRKFLIDTGKSILAGVKTVGKTALPFVEEAYVAAAHADARAKELRPALDDGFNRVLKCRPTLMQAVYRACLLARAPLTPAEVFAAAVRHGAKSRAKNPLKSVKRVLRKHPLLILSPDGRWQVIAVRA
jgi:predicted nucleic acid-binding protein